MSAQLQEQEELAVYRKALEALNQAEIPFLVGGAYALQHYTGIEHWTKDLDLFIEPAMVHATLDVLSEAGFRTEITFDHWIAKAFSGRWLIDLIFSSGNGIARVDAEWFEHSASGELLEVPIRFCAPEEIIWSKGFIMERERYDGADIMHVLRAVGRRLDWPRLLERFGPNWRVLLSHLILFGFTYPAERSVIPDWVMRELLQRGEAELHGPAPTDRVCHGTLLSLQQYLVDLDHWDYEDARLEPRGPMTAEQIKKWTDAFLPPGGV